MRKIRIVLSVLLMINFFIGLAQGMKNLNLVLVIINGLLVIMLAVIETRKAGR